MKTFIALFTSLVLGIGLGITVGWLRFASTPWDGEPAVDALAERETAVPSSVPSPKAVIDRTEYDFGTLELEKIGRQEFTVTNRGNAVLKLSKGETTCRCAASDLEKTDLDPGESTKIKLTWRPTEEPGPYQQSASFGTNDPTRPRLTITVKGKITATLRVKPSTLTLSRISAREKSQGRLTILNYLEQPLEINNPRFDENDTAKYFDVTTSPLSESELKEHWGAKSGFTLVVTVKPGLPQGPFKQTINVTTNNPHRKELAIPIEGSVGTEISIVGPGWDIERETLYLGTVKSQEGLSRRLLLVVRGPYRREVQFKTAEPPPVPLKVTLGKTVEINDGQVTQTPLIVEIPKGSPQASHLGHMVGGEGDVPDEDSILVLETTHPEMHKLRLPIRFAIEK